MGTATERSTGHHGGDLPFDAEISLKGTLWTGAGILLITLAGMGSMWLFSKALLDYGTAREEPLLPVELERRGARSESDETLQGDPAYDRRVRGLGGVVPPPLAETFPFGVDLPPGPRVQYSPRNDMLVLRHAQGERLAGWEWLDPEAGIARVPIERAMDFVLERGLVVGDEMATGERAPELGDLP
jgi:hypothetical protein